MVSSTELGFARHDDLLRMAEAAGHAFAPVEDGQMIARPADCAAS